MDQDHPISSPSGHTYLYKYLVELVVHFSWHLFPYFNYLVLRYPKKECLRPNGISTALFHCFFCFLVANHFPHLKTSIFRPGRTQTSMSWHTLVDDDRDGKSIQKLLALSQQEVIALLVNQMKMSSTKGTKSSSTISFSLLLRAQILVLLIRKS